jgi:hypothetical protein
VSPSQAKNLRVGDNVVAFNGPYMQEGTITKIEPHHRSGFWITFQWERAKGGVATTRKTHNAVWLPSQV